MPWFYVDDAMAFNKKIVAAGNAAVGLWSRAGAWSRGEGTNGFIPADMARSLGTAGQAKKLVDVGLWLKVKGGYEFHEWSDRYDAVRDAERSRKRAEAGRRGGVRAGEARRAAGQNAGRSASNGEAKAEAIASGVKVGFDIDFAKKCVPNSGALPAGTSAQSVHSDLPVLEHPDTALPADIPKQAEANASAIATANPKQELQQTLKQKRTHVLVLNSGYLSGKGYVSNARAKNEQPPRNCTQHPQGTTAPCRACGDARRAAEDWDSEQRRALAAARSTNARLAAEARAAAIAACGLCDDDGWDGRRSCPHTETSTAAARNAAKAQFAKHKQTRNQETK